mmetsp:Transcript_60244/g.137669  ORF Transcript_60244/g.137669 Transcript_60244/m.137669 type:complete len:226 (-) Transcript_60244:13-690(-)
MLEDLQSGGSSIWRVFRVFILEGLHSVELGGTFSLLRRISGVGLSAILLTMFQSSSSPFVETPICRDPRPSALGSVFLTPVFDGLPPRRRFSPPLGPFVFAASGSSKLSMVGALSASSFLGAAAAFLGAPKPPPPPALFAGLALASIDSAESPRGLAAAHVEACLESERRALPGARSERSAAGAKEYPVAREAQAMSAVANRVTEGEGRILERGITGARQIFWGS